MNNIDERLEKIVRAYQHYHESDVFTKLSTDSEVQFIINNAERLASDWHGTANTGRFHFPHGIFIITASPPEWESEIRTDANKLGIRINHYVGLPHVGKPSQSEIAAFKAKKIKEYNIQVYLENDEEIIRLMAGYGVDPNSIIGINDLYESLQKKRDPWKNLWPSEHPDNPLWAPFPPPDATPLPTDKEIQAMINKAQHVAIDWHKTGNTMRFNYPKGTTIITGSLPWLERDILKRAHSIGLKLNGYEGLNIDHRPTQEDIAKHKARKVQELGIDLFLDDDEEVVQLMRKYNPQANVININQPIEAEKVQYHGYTISFKEYERGWGGNATRNTDGYRLGIRGHCRTKGDLVGTLMDMIDAPIGGIEETAEATEEEKKNATPYLKAHGKSHKEILKMLADL